MVSPSRRALVDELAEHDRLVEVGVGNRPGVAKALAERGSRVVAVDIDPGERTLAAARGTQAEGVEGSLRTRRADVLALAESGAGEIGIGTTVGTDGGDSVDAVYACNLPAELQRPTVALADRLDAACAFTTLGFEEPVVPVHRRSVEGTALYVARAGGRGTRSAGSD